MTDARATLARLRVLTRQELDRQTCGVPGCTHESHAGSELYMHPRCHAGQGLEVCYLEGKLLVMCRVCKKPVASVEVK
jgi:hypothetical protein